MLGIVIPAYNRGDKLREALRSLTMQTMTHFFVCVVDDASTEDIKSVCDEFADSLYIAYVRQPENGGAGMARERGIQWAIELNLELIMFLDSDDLLFPNAVQALTHEINHGRYDFVMSEIVTERGNEPQFTIKGENALTWHHGTIYRVKFLKDKDIHFMPGLRTNEDLAFNLCTYYATENKATIDAQLYLWRNDSDSITRTDSPLKRKCNGTDYIKATWWAYQYCHRTQVKSFERLAPNLLCCYNYYQLTIERGDEMEPIIIEYLKDLATAEEFQQLFSNINIWRKMSHNIWPYAYYNKRLYAFHQTFYDWWIALGGKDVFSGD